MKQFYILRHAAAQPEEVRVKDRDRPLSLEGFRELDMVRRQSIGIFKGLSTVMCSNSRRTRQTLDALKALMPQDCDILYDDLLYQAPCQTILKQIATVSPKVPSLLVVGHNPGLSQLVQGALPFFNNQKKYSYPTLPTAGLMICTAHVKKWEELIPAKLEITQFLQAQS